MSKPIPFPETEPFLGQIRAIDSNKPVQSFMNMMKKHGPIFRIYLPGGSSQKKGNFYMVGSYQLTRELCDSRRFVKALTSPLERLRGLAGDGLFTAENDEPNWKKAHDILLPAFLPSAVRKMFPAMQDICEQMLLRWERFGPEEEFEVSDHMTRLTLDTIALCAFGSRFNSFYQEKMHPFIESMVKALDHAGDFRFLPPPYKQWLEHKHQQNLQTMQDISNDIIAKRRADPNAAQKDDLLSCMLNGRDPKTGQGLSDENIRYQMATFLIAGHETTSGLLSFAIYFLLKNPAVLQKARQEVEEAVSQRQIQINDLSNLKYIDQILRETLRIWPTAPLFAVKPRQTTLLGAGAYTANPNDHYLVLLPSVHRDLAVWGPDVEAFRPERFSSENLRYLPQHAWKPFGTGQRVCIGRPFAMQEATLVLASIIQRFDLELANPNYQLSIKETLTLKPENLRIRAKLRSEWRPTATNSSSASSGFLSSSHSQSRQSQHQTTSVPTKPRQPAQPSQTVQRVLQRFELQPDTTHNGQPVSQLLDQLNLADTATPQQLERLIATTHCPPEKAILQRMASNFKPEVIDEDLSVLDLLEKVQGCELSFADFVMLLT